MAEWIVLGMFLVGLCACVGAGVSVLYALAFGLVCFAGYCLYRGFSLRETGRMMLGGVAQVKGILIIFALIGCLTASWRVSGTIPLILMRAAGLVVPRVFALSAFLLCCGMSFLTGTAFGAASTMGVIMMMLSNAAGLSPVVTGGAILSGAFFGDRCSPMSSSAQLVAALTGTHVYRNIGNMMRSAALPFAATCILYALLGSGQAQVDGAVGATLARAFSMHWAALLPVAAILLLAALRVDVKWAMGVSIVLSIVVALTVERVTVLTLARCLVLGYQPADAGLQALLGGGGLVSMARVAMIITISSAYSGIFAKTGLITGVVRAAQRSVRFLTPFGTVLTASVFACAVSCNQTLAVMLSAQMCDKVYDRPEDMALALEDSAILVAPLIPWSIAGAVPLATIGAPLEAIALAFFLYLVPLWHLAGAVIRRMTAARAAEG